MNKSSLQSPIKQQHRKIISQQQGSRPFRFLDRLQLFTKHRIPLIEETPQRSERQSRRLKKYYSATMRNSSCNCVNCGKNNSFIQKTFQLFPFESKYFQSKKETLQEVQEVRSLCAVHHSIQDCIKIRDRQRNKMKKAINQNVHIHKPSAVANLLAEGIKQLRQQHHVEVLNEHDSDEEFYHFKPKMLQNRKSFAHFLSSPKGQKVGTSLLCQISQQTHQLIHCQSLKAVYYPMFSQIYLALTEFII